MKRIYYLLSDNADLGNMVFDNLEAIMDWIKAEADSVTKEDLEDYEYTIGFQLMTEDEYQKICDET